MQQGLSRAEIQLGFGPGTRPFYDGFEVIQGLEAAVSDWGVDPGPQAFSWPPFWRVGRQRHDLGACGMSLRSRDMEAAPILDHQNVVIVSCAHSQRECGHHPLIGIGVQGRHDPQVAVSGFRIDKRGDVEPRVAGTKRPDQWLARRCPDGAPNWGEAQTTFVYRPQRDLRTALLRAVEAPH